MNDMEDFLNGITAALDAGEIDVAEAAQRTVRYVQLQIGCDMVACWVLLGEAPERSARRIAFVDVDDPDAHLKPVELNPAQCADYLDLISTGGLFMSTDAQHDPFLAPMRELYLVPCGIRSTMCVTIAVNGESTSVISCSQRSTARVWTAAEVATMQRLAAQISLRRARRRARERVAASLGEQIAPGQTPMPAGR